MDIALLVLLIVPIIAQDDSTCFEQCPENVIGLLNDRFFSALRKVESDGDVCMISGNRIGPYQISEKYYNDSVKCRPSLKIEGMRWSFVWGKGGRSYSEEVIKSYICREAMMRSTSRQMSHKALAGLHKGGFPLGLSGAYAEFRNAVWQAFIKLAGGEIPPPRDPEICDPVCALGQCCINGRCHCFNSEEISMMPCTALPNIIKQPLSTTYKIHSKSCELECFAASIGHIQYKWEKYQSSSNSWIRPSHRVVNITSPKLIFSVITEEDEGIYHCIATNHVGSVVSKSANITVYGPPVINFIINNTITFEGNEVNLICNATNDDDAINPLSIDWYNSDGIKLVADEIHRLVYNTTDPVTGQVQSVLLFDPVNHTDSGEYTCHAFNDNDCYTEVKTNLTVEYAPIVSISPQSLPIIHVGYNYLLLLCNAKGLPIPTVQWFLGDRAIKDFAALYEQAYYIPTTSPHITVYTCVSRNKAGGEIHTVKANVTVIVQLPPPPCPSIAPPENGMLVLNDGKVAFFSCNAPYYVVYGSPILRCIDGKWNMSPPKCVNAC